jgi:hypothetical protein
MPRIVREGAGTLQRRQVAKFFCEALREIGILIMVFAALDRTFNSAGVSTWALLVWLFVGFAALLTGIYAAPEVRK